MMEESAENNIYNLITSLCEKFSNDQSVVKKLRSKAYEILLKKRITDSNFNFKNIKAPDSYCNLLAWQYILVTQYGLVEHGSKIQECGEYIHSQYGDDIIHFLMCLRDLPSDSNDPMELEMPESLNSLSPAITSVCSTNTVRDLDDMSTSSDVWDLVLKTPFSKRKTWEDFGHAEPDMEKPFLSEIGDKPDLWVKNLPSVSTTLKFKTSKEFVKDVKYLLVGMASYSFSYNETGDFVLLPDITVTGKTPVTLKSFSQEFTFCGACYKALHEISTPNPYSGKYKQDGYIFAELCQSIQRYLEYYRSAIISIPDTVDLLKLHERTNKLRNHLKTLTEICKVGPYSTPEGIPHGVSLLNYLYHTALNVTDKNLLLVLYAILFPCCQVYFSRFLQQWLLEGMVNDPYGEFFIKPNFKYISTRGRTYWTRSYSLRNYIVPDFLEDLKTEILNCGKTMNLLKLCMSSGKLCSYLMGTKPLIISCCLTSEQLSMLKQNATSYYLEVLAECGSKINLEDVVKRDKEQDPIFMNLIAKKRAVTLKRLELERKKKLQEIKEKKFDEMTILKEQYDSALQLKQSRVASEIETEMKQIEFDLSIEHFRDKLIEKEANQMIDYYNKLYEVSEERKKKVETHIEKLKSYCLEQVPLNSNSSEESFHSLDDQAEEEETEEKFVDSSQDLEDLKQIHSSKSLDIINANDSTSQETSLTTMETFEMARKIKEKVLSEEMGIIISAPKEKQISTLFTNEKLTDAQRNKMKVLNSEFGIEIKPQIKKSLTQCEINRNLVLGSSECFYPKLDNLDYLNKDLNSKVDNKKIKKSVSLSLDIVRNDIPVPMSVDTTPMSESTSKMLLSVEKGEFESIPTTAETQMTDEGFPFDGNPETVYLPIKRNSGSSPNKVFSKRVTKEEASGLSTNCLDLFLHESISIPLETQTKLADNELLKYFINNLQYFKHLNSLRDYFFLQDGEFGRNMTENLFGKLYDAHFPIELINCRTLQNLVFDALQMSSKFQENSGCLSFKINALPKRFHLGDPDVLDCLSLSYKVNWPLNILLPIDTIGKYSDVFKYLLKLNRISWVLKKILLELKMLAKLSGKKEIYLMMSPHYRRLHQCRHIMLHFIQTLQNYVVGEVLQSSWEIFQTNLSSVNNLDSLYLTHTNYIKNILFLCFLNQKSAPLRKVIQKIFVVILKFYDYLRSASWTCEDGTYVHPNFAKLEKIFLNFEEFVLYLFKVGRKVAKSGYQPHLTQLLDMLDVNGYYSNRNSVDVA